jgi:hypothetical protein
MNSLFQIEIPRRSAECFKGQEPLTPGTEYYSLLVNDEDEKKWVRRDFCPNCWQTMKEDVSAGQSYWRSRIEEKPEVVAPISTKTGRALQILKDLLSRPDGNEAEIFVLVLYLAHARQLILRRDFEKEGIGYQVYEIAKQDEFLTIKKVSLMHLEGDLLQQSLSSKLKEK